VKNSTKIRFVPVHEKCVDDTITQWVDGQFGDAKKVVSVQIALTTFVQIDEARIQTHDLIARNCKMLSATVLANKFSLCKLTSSFLLNLLDFLLLQH
jgi:citrate lyase gamma subunit